MRYSIALWFALSLLSVQAQEKPAQIQQEGNAGSAPLSFAELVTLSSTAKPEGRLATKLESLLATPSVHNDATAEGAQPRRPAVEGLGPVLRVGLWNIERGLKFELIRAALTDTNDFEQVAGEQGGIDASRKDLIESQLATLQNVDILVLNEVDLGMKRTEYRDVARQLAVALHMNYAYGVEFVEVDPVFALGTEEVHLPEVQQDRRLQQDLQVHRDLYRGLHGTAILSRYPIRSARILRLPMCYDWYGEEVKDIAKVEKGKRWAAQKLFKERIAREVRRGGRMALIAEVGIPQLPTGEATIVATHLENRCKPACRLRQMETLLANLKQDRNPLVIAGDLNTTGKSNTPTSLRNEITRRVTDYQFWIRQGVSHFHPLGIYQHVLFPVHYFHGYQDPTAFHFPILWDNRERPLFTTMRKFRFEDERALDFRGDPGRSLQHRSRTLSDSNDRGAKGFVPTYAFARDYRGLVGRFKLDWILVKPLEESGSQAQSTVFAPRFPKTMRELNESVANRIADHAPMTVDLPLPEQPMSPQPMSPSGGIRR